MSQEHIRQVLNGSNSVELLFPYVVFFDPLASVYSSSHDNITTVVFSSTRSSIVLHEAKVKRWIITIAVSHRSLQP